MLHVARYMATGSGLGVCREQIDPDAANTSAPVRLPTKLLTSDHGLGQSAHTQELVRRETKPQVWLRARASLPARSDTPSPGPVPGVSGPVKLES